MFLQNRVDAKSVVQETYLTPRLLYDDTILQILSSKKFFRKEGVHVDWLVSVIGKLAVSYDPQAEQTLIRIEQQSLEVRTAELRQLT